MKTITNGYDCRAEIKRLGGRYDGSGAWEVTDEQLAKLVEMAAESSRRSNKRDTALGRAFAAVEVEGDDGETVTGAELMAPVVARLAAEAEAYAARFR